MPPDSAPPPWLETPEREPAFVRPPPHNFQAEADLLGGLLVENKFYYLVSDTLKPEHFADPLNGRIYTAIGTLIQRNVVASPITLLTLFQEDLEKLGHAEHLHRLTRNTMALFEQNIISLGREIVHLAQRRRLIMASRMLEEMAFDPNAAISDAVASTETELIEVRVAVMDRRSGLRPISAGIDEAIGMAEAAHRQQGVIGLSTGILAVDRIIGGLCAPDLVILAGRPSMGKTGVLVSAGYNVAKRLQETTPEGQESPVAAIFSLETAQAAMAGRILGHAVKKGWERFRTGRSSPTDMQHLLHARDAVAALPMYMDDDAGLTIGEMAARLSRLANRRRIALIGVDYLQLIGSDGQRRDANRTQEVTDITKGLKELGKRFDCPVLALSQVSRKCEEREDKRPQLQDLRESGSIEQDADVVVFVYRDEYYLSRSEPSDQASDKWSKWRTAYEKATGVAELIVAKQKVGPTGTAKVRFDAATQWFDDQPEDRHEQGDLIPEA